MTTGVRGQRWGWISRVAAVCLLLLVVSPFTAPFATFDFNHDLQATLLDDSAASKDKASQIVLMVSRQCASPSILADTPRVSRARVAISFLPAGAPIPLRI